MKNVLRIIFIGLTLTLLACSTTSTSKNILLVEAAEKGNTSEVEKLILAGADINATNKSGFTPYMAASTNGHFETMKVLEKAGAQKITRDPLLH